MTPGRVLGEIQAVKSGMTTVLASEEEITRARAAKMAEARRENTRREEAEAAKAAALLTSVKSQQRQAVEQAQAALDARKAWLQKAHQGARNSLAKSLQAKKDRRIGKLQGSIFTNRQTRKRQLARATELHRHFQARLAADRNTRHELRDSALKALRSFRVLLQPLCFGQTIRLDEAAATMQASELHAESIEHLTALRTQVEALHRQPLTKFFRFVPLAALAVIVAGVQLGLAWQAGKPFESIRLPLLLAEGILLLIWLQALALAFFGARGAGRELATARALAVAAEKASAAHVAKLAAEFEQEHHQQGQELSSTFHDTSAEWQAEMREGQKALDAKLARLPAKVDRLHQRKLAKLERRHQAAMDRAQRQIDELAAQRQHAHAQLTAAIEAETTTGIHTLTEPWQRQVLTHCDHLTALEQASASEFPPFTPAFCAEWTPPAIAPAAVRIGTLQLDLTQIADRGPTDARLALPEPPVLAVPFALGFADHGSLLIETDGDSAAASTALATVALRVFASLPPGRASFVFIDPVGLGRDFAGLMHLADYEETLITHRIWTQSTQIEERLAELNEHIEKVIQMYLRNEYETIAEYNEQAGVIAEKYRFLVIASFPSAFSETAAKRLLAIASSGARCGVHLLIHRDLRLPAPDPALDGELRRVCMRLVPAKNGYTLADWPAGARAVTLDPPPADDDATTLIHRIGRASVDSNRVEVPFAHIAPADGEYWTGDTTNELRVPIGRTGAKKLQMLAIGKGTRQHMLVAGKTGSGKSTLFHVIITNLALWCRPDQVEFYLVDFKKGVEFKCYATKQLPHARVVAIESDREFALSVLQRVDAELKRRGELFRRAGSQDVAGYKATAGAEPMPRTLLLIDEFQEFFTEDDAVAQEASLLLDRIVRQGRAFGIHVILGSQTLGGAYTLARATLGQMVIRVALQCNEADAHLIMEDDNPAPRLLTRPGEGIYNDQAGALAANSPFQIVWLPEAERDAMLDQVHALAAGSGQPVPAPIVFEGNAPAEIRDNPELAAALAVRPATRPKTAKAWLGAPNSIKGPTAAVFQRQSGNHLLVVSQAAERTLALLGINMLSLAAQYPAGAAEFVILDPHGPDTASHDFFHRLAALLPHPVRLVLPVDVAAAMNDLAAALDARTADSTAEAPEIFLLIHDLQRFKALRPDDDFRFSLDDDAGGGTSPAQVLANVLGEGGPAGLHVIAAIDTWNNVSRWVPRKMLGEFEMRVLFQMSANDSANLIDSPAASTLGMHRALFHNEHYGTLETFRPYAMPDNAWLEEIGTGFAQD
jgi:hypothetical protein